MLTKTVEMAKRDDKTRFMVAEAVEVRGVELNIRNRCRDRGGRVFTDMLLDEPVYFKPGEIKTLVISEVEANRLRERKKHEEQLKRITSHWVEPETWELTTEPPTPIEEEKEAIEPTSSEASAQAAVNELIDVTVADDDGTPGKREESRTQQRMQRTVQRKE